MTKAKCVHSTPPTNTSALPVDPTRRRFLTVAAAGAAAIATSAPAGAALAEPDPIYAAIERHRMACIKHTEAVHIHMAFEEIGMTGAKLEKYESLVAETDAAYDSLDDVGCDLINTKPRPLPAFWRSVDTSPRSSRKRIRPTCRRTSCTTTTPRRPRPKRFAM